MLHEVDPMDPIQLRGIYDSLLITTDSDQPPPSITPLAASGVSMEAAVDYFRLKNVRVERFGFIKTIIPEYVLDSQSVSSLDRKNWGGMYGKKLWKRGGTNTHMFII